MLQDSPRVVVFDLDDTLYLERDFAMSGFRAAGNWLNRETGIGGLEALCAKLFQEGQRTNIFDDAVRLLAPQRGALLVNRLVEVYRHHVPDITLADDAKRYLERYSGRVSFGLITDGPAETQKAKIKSLNIEHYFDCIVCTGDWGREYWKPHPRSYEHMERRFAAEGHEMVYIADNPAKDFVTPKARGWWTVQLARLGRIHTQSPVSESHSPHERIETLDGYEPCLKPMREDH